MSAFKLPDTSQSQLISTAELAKIISYKSQTIRKWLCQDKLPEGLPRPNHNKGRHNSIPKPDLHIIATNTEPETQ